MSLWTSKDFEVARCFIRKHFSLGARQTGKSTLLKMLFPDVLIVDLASRMYMRNTSEALTVKGRASAMTADGSGPVIIDGKYRRSCQHLMRSTG